MTGGTAADISPALAAWGEALRDDIDAHFAEAHQRVESVYRQHFRSLPTVLGEGEIKCVSCCRVCLVCV